MGESLRPMAPPRAGHHPSLRFLCHLPPFCQALPHSRSIRRAFLPDDSVLCVPSIMAQADTLSTGASHAGRKPRSTVSLGQVIYTQGRGHICTRPSLLNRRTRAHVHAHMCCSTTEANCGNRLLYSKVL